MTLMGEMGGGEVGRKILEGGGCIYTHKTDSLCSTAETKQHCKAIIELKYINKDQAFIS